MGNGMNCVHDEVPDNVTLQPIAFASIDLSCAEWCHSNIEWDTVGMLYGLERFYHYCFAKEVCILTDHKALVLMISKVWTSCPTD